MDSFTPPQRLLQIEAEAKPAMILAVEPLIGDFKAPIIGREEIERFCQTEVVPVNLNNLDRDDICYIMFTSGSTGRPKGVPITASSLDSFVLWAAGLMEAALPPGKALTVLNQASLAFDLSVLDVYTSLYKGARLWLQSREVQSSIGCLFKSMRRSEGQVMVSTPSFAEMCLADKSFNRDLLPDLKLLMFCGETLYPGTASRLFERFPGIGMVNMYGPTEATVAVTGLMITEQMARREPCLPVGYVRPGSEVKIDGSGLEKDGGHGEIVVFGESLSPGYLNHEDSRGAFGLDPNNGQRFYRTGDQGFLKGALLYCQGRLDNQIKLHGHRIEMEDIEANILRIDGVKIAVVVPISNESGKITSLTAVVSADLEGSSDFEKSQWLRKNLATFMPPYMVPKKFIFSAGLPLNANGKIDRVKINEMVNGKK